MVPRKAKSKLRIIPLGGLGEVGKNITVFEYEDDEATILKEMNEEDDAITYALVEDENEFQRVTLLFMESDEYDIEV